MIQVIKRNGRKEDLQISRIREVATWACEGLTVNELTLEAGLKTRLRDGITTREIQDSLIQCALENCTLEDSDYRYVAGRLLMWSLWKDTFISRGYGYEGYIKSLNSKIFKGIYDKRLEEYNYEELKEASSWLDQKYDLDYDYAGALLLTSRYLLPDELPQEAFLTCALLLALSEFKENRLEFAKQTYLSIAQRKISLATPILANLRVPNGSLTSCFIITADDNLESIFREITNTARISKNGGGVGVNLSKIRATGASVMGHPNASGGVVSWIKLLNDTAVAVNQGGKRSGAVTVGLDIWHYDIPEFLELQTENGDQRRKAYDVFPQVIIPDLFMQRVKSNSDWTLFDPYEIKKKFEIDLTELWGTEFESAYRIMESYSGDLTLRKTVNARELFKEIMKSQVETGMPYLAFKDTINKYNANKHDGYIPQINLCCESFSNVASGKYAHCCNLVSLNLANIEDEDELATLSQLAVNILDNTIDLTSPPFEDAKAHNDRYRTIGVGTMGLADYLAKHGLSYTKLDAIGELYEIISYNCILASAMLAGERGKYLAYEGSDWSKELVLSKPLEWFENNGTQDWESLFDLIRDNGIRNSMLMAIAPNTSSSLVQGCTASILPCYSKFYYDKWSKGTVPIAPPFIKESLWYYRENKTLDQNIVVKAVAEIQKWIDTGISMELIFNLNEGVYGDNALSAKDIYDVMINAWESECKAVYYVRIVQKDNFQESCVSCAN
jgi:ribonucleoside-diphosphate reductase alpha chain